MNMEQFMERELAQETQASGENLHWSHFSTTNLM
jgi:hypothetical protein